MIISFSPLNDDGLLDDEAVPIELYCDMLQCFHDTLRVGKINILKLIEGGDFELIQTIFLLQLEEVRDG